MSPNVQGTVSLCVLSIYPLTLQENLMNWLSALLPVWIIGAPVVYSVFDWMSTSKSTTAMTGPRLANEFREPVVIR